MASTQWLRLWHELPNDPKFRTIARASGQEIARVLAVYLHLLVDASTNATERGRTQSLTSEDIASALDVDPTEIEPILEAMQGRLLDGDRILGWEKRQPKREDGSADRARLWRQEQAAKKAQQQAQDEDPERDRTQPNAGEPKRRVDISTLSLSNDPPDSGPEQSPTAAQDPPPPMPQDDGRLQPMRHSWKPDARYLKASAKTSGLPVADCLAQLPDFVTHFAAEPHHLTEAQWVAKLVLWTKRDKARNAQGATNKNNREGKPRDWNKPRGKRDP